jgi:hypothetical protein
MHIILNCQRPLSADKRVCCLVLRLLACLLSAAGYHWDYVFDWTVLKHVHNQNLQRQVNPRPDGAGQEQQQQQPGAERAGIAVAGGAAAGADAAAGESSRRR